MESFSGRDPCCMSNARSSLTTIRQPIAMPPADSDAAGRRRRGPNNLYVYATPAHRQGSNGRETSVESRRRIFRSAAAVSFGTLVSPPNTIQPADAISAEEASRSYDAYAPSYDDLDGGSAASALGIDAARSSLLSRARGHVLEGGVGTGLNANRYRFGGEGGVTALTLVDISDGMLSEARAKVSKLGLPSGVKVEFVRADATKDLVGMFGSSQFDTVVDTFSLCVMGNEGAKKCLSQLRDVVKPADQVGKLLLIENTRSSNPLLGMYQDATAEKASEMGGKGCVYNQDVTSMLKSTKGLDIVAEEAFAAGLFRSFEVVKRQ